MGQEQKLNVEVSELSPVLRELKVEIPWEVVSRAVEQRYGELRKSARPMRGFRKGRAPKWLLEQQFGPLVEAEVTQKVVSEALIKAFEDKDLAPVATPMVDPGDFVKGKPLTFTARVEVRPEVKDLKYDGLEVVRTIREVADEEITAEVDKLREEVAAVRPLAPPRPAEAGDVLIVSYDVHLPDKEEPERKVEDQEVEIGKGLLLEKVEDALIGTSAGDEKEVEVEFPDLSKGADEQKRVILKLQVKDVREKVLPELDDEFAKDVSEHETLLELRLGLRKKLEKEVEKAAEGAVREQIIDALVDANEVEVPPSLVDNQANETQQELARMLQLDLDKQPLGEEQVARIRESAERKVRAALLLGEVASAGNIDVSDEDLDARLVEIAEGAGQPLPKVRAELGKGDRMEQLRSSILQERVVDELMSKANITDKSPEEVEAEKKADEESVAAKETESGAGEGADDGEA